MFKKIKVSKYKDKYYLDFREYFFDKNGQANPTKKGINLPLNELPFLIKILQDIKENLDNIQGPK
jgi:hypothetical protein